MQSGMAYLIKIDTNGNAVLLTLAGNAKKADASLHKIGGTSQKSFGTLTQSARASNSILSKTKGLLAGIGLTLTTGAFAAGIVGLGANFQKSMSEVKALTNASAIEMKLLEGSARQAGATTEHTALSSSKAMGYLAMAGFNTNQIVAALPGTLSLASAGNLELAKSADIATNILTQFQMKASDTGVVVDQLAYLQASANTNIEEAADAMNYIGPKAASMGISLSETNAAIGLLASGGYKGSLATRALGTSLVRLTKPTNEMQEKIDELNLTLFDSQGKFVGLAGMVEQLEDSYASLTPQQQLNATSTLFGAEAVDKWTVLLNAGSDTIRQYTDDIEGATGAARRMAETKMDNLSGDWLKLQSATQEVGLKLFDEVAPALRAATMEATLFIQNMDTREIGLYLTQTVNTLYKGVIWLKNNHLLIIGLGKAYVALRIGMMLYNKANLLANMAQKASIGLQYVYIAATRSAAVANRALGVSMMMTPWGAVAGAIGVVVAAMGMFAIKTKAAREEVENLNLDDTEKKLHDKEIADLRPNTKDALKRLNAGGLTENQYSKEISEAKTRIETINDELLDLRLKSDSLNSRKYFQGNKNNNPFGIDLRSDTQKDLDAQKEAARKMAFIGEALNVNSKKSSLNDLLNQNKNIIANASQFVNDPTLRSNATGGVIADSETTSDNVVSGGSKQRIINVTVESIENKLNFSVKDRLDEISSSVEELYSIINNQMMRVFNNANQLAD